MCVSVGERGGGGGRTPDSVCLHNKAPCSVCVCGGNKNNAVCVCVISVCGGNKHHAFHSVFFDKIRQSISLKLSFRYMTDVLSIYIFLTFEMDHVISIFSCRLKPFQMVGLNWLRIMHSQQLNGILADEMVLILFSKRFPGKYTFCKFYMKLHIMLSAVKILTLNNFHWEFL